MAVIDLPANSKEDDGMDTRDMKLVVVGAAGRMGQTLIRIIHAMPGAVLHAAVEREGSPFIGKDAGELAGLGPNGVIIGDKPLTDAATRRASRHTVF